MKRFKKVSSDLQPSLKPTYRNLFYTTSVLQYGRCHLYTMALSTLYWILHQSSPQKPTRYALAGHSLSLLQKPRQTTEAIEAAIHHGISILLYRHNFLIILSIIQ